MEQLHVGLELTAGTRLGRYQIVRRIARGGMAELYLARHIGRAGFEKVVAIKRVLPHLTEDREFIRMFLNEARLAAGLDHSSIAHVIDYGSEGGEHFMAMEYIHGRSVHDLLRQGPVPLPSALLIAQRVAAALHYAHERLGADGKPLGLVHRDVSPSNVLVSYDGDVKLVDFGIAKATARSRGTQTGTIKGKLAYMAPEQIRGEALDRRADVFALGILAYELTVGKRCFFAQGEFALINRVAEARFERPSRLVAGFPAALEAILLRALAADLEQRYATAREVQRALEAYAAEASIPVSSATLSDHMLQSFGGEAYPATDTFPVPTRVATQPSGRPETKEDLPSPASSRRLIGWVGMALAAGLGLGLGVPRLLEPPGDEASPSVESVQQPAVMVETETETEPGAGDRSVAPTDPVAAPTSTEDELVEIVDGDSKPAAEVPPASRRRSRPRKRRSKVKPTPGSSHEYLPPSRRK